MINYLTDRTDKLPDISFTGAIIGFLSEFVFFLVVLIVAVLITYYVMKKKIK